MARPHVHVEAADPLHPSSAAHTATAARVSSFPLHRPLTGLLVGWQDTPGLAVTPWTLRGVLDALPGTLRQGWEPLAVPRASDRALRTVSQDIRRDARALERGAVGERRVPLRVGGHKRAATIPRAWVGSSLLVVAPMSHRRARWSASAGGATGPVELVLATLARRCGLEGSTAALVKGGASIVAAAFCDAWLILDATWWTAQDGDALPVGDPTAIEHCLGTAAIADAREAAAVDQWIGALLGHPGSHGVSTPRISGRRRPWPSVGLPRPRSPGPKRAFDALWGTARNARAGRESRGGWLGLGALEGQGRTAAALAPAAPGRFADHWTQWSPSGRGPGGLR